METPIARGIAVSVFPLIAVVFALGSCSSSGTTGSGTGVVPIASGSSAGGTPTSPIVGRWETNRTCQGLVSALREVNLEPLAPSEVGDYFPGEDPKTLAKKADVCDGATAQAHSHFFTSEGEFGSLDQDGNQVDDGKYRVINDQTIQIGKVTFRYKIDAQELTLAPVITQAMRRQALADPLGFSDAGWAVAVAYLGHTWHRVDCGGWC